MATRWRWWGTRAGSDLSRLGVPTLVVAAGADLRTALAPEVTAAIAEAKAGFEAAMAGFRLDRASEASFGAVRFLNKYIDTRAPWALAKAGDPALASVVRSMLACLRATEGLIRPMLPSTADAIAEQLGVPPTRSWAAVGDDATLPAGTSLLQPQPIFPRLEPEKPKPAAPPAEPTPREKIEAPDDTITIDEFAKVQFRIGRVLEAEALEGSDRLLKLQVMVGEERRQIVAGIRSTYNPIDLIGRQVVVVANLKPAMLRGTESQGMLLAAVDEAGGAVLLQPDRETPEGAKVR